MDSPAVHVILEMPFCTGKPRKSSYVTAGPEFAATLCGKNLIINKSLYGLKTSAARFH
jgi:hypothetical protein